MLGATVSICPGVIPTPVSIITQGLDSKTNCAQCTCSHFLTPSLISSNIPVTVKALHSWPFHIAISGALKASAPLPPYTQLIHRLHSPPPAQQLCYTI